MIDRQISCTFMCFCLSIKREKEGRVKCKWAICNDDQYTHFFTKIQVVCVQDKTNIFVNEFGKTTSLKNENYHSLTDCCWNEHYKDKLK